MSLIFPPIVLLFLCCAVDQAVRKSIFFGSGVGFIVNAFVTLVCVGLLDVPMVEGIIVVCVFCLAMGSFLIYQGYRVKLVYDA
jgi:hypothetical protein